jgi:hypothetical protein
MRSVIGASLAVVRNSANGTATNGVYPALKIMQFDCPEAGTGGRRVTLEAVWKLIGVVSRNISGAQSIAEVSNSSASPQSADFVGPMRV